MAKKRHRRLSKPLKHDATSAGTSRPREFQVHAPGATRRRLWSCAIQRNPDLDPQLVWRGKDQQDWSDLVVQAPPLYIQEKVHPKALIDDLPDATKASASTRPG